MTTLEEKEKTAEELRPPNHDYSHQDSLFGNAFSSRAYFVVHPEWLSENVDPPKSKPLDRPPWPWEQPKYRQNIKLSDLRQKEEEEKLKKEKEANGITSNGDGVQTVNGNLNDDHCVGASNLTYDVKNGYGLRYSS